MKLCTPFVSRRYFTVNFHSLTNSSDVVHDAPHEDHVTVCSWKGRKIMGLKLPSLPRRLCAISASRSSHSLKVLFVVLPSVRISATTRLLELSHESPPVSGLLMWMHEVSTMPRS